MAKQLSISQIIAIAKIAQYKAATDQANKLGLKGGVLDPKLPRLLYMERKGIERQYSLNPNDSTLQALANYLFQLCGPYQLQAQTLQASLAGVLPVVTGPSNVTVSAGSNATFTITVTSTTAYTIQWYRNGVIIAGATGLTYTLNSAQSSDSGSVFSAIVTNATGSANSAQATLTVTAVINAFAYYGATDPYPALSAGTDNLTYQITQAITHNASFTITWPLAAANNQFEVIKEPVTEYVKTAWYNTPLSNGQIPDQVFRAPITIGAFRYYVSRVSMSLDSTVLTETFS